MSENNEVLRPDKIDANSPQPLTSKVKLPDDNYVVRCQKAEFKFSKASNNPMVVLTFEICKHRTPGGLKDTVAVSGRHYSVGGVLCRPMHLICTKDGAWRLYDAQKMFGLDQRFDPAIPEEIAKEFLGKIANAKCKGVEYIERRGLTDEEVSSGMKREDAPPLTYEDGSSVKGYNCEVVKLLEASSVSLPPSTGQS